MKLKMGFIGFGKSTNRYHLPYVLTRDHIQVKMIYSRTRKPELEEQYREHGILFTDELNSLLNDKEIQLISICTSHSSHYEFAKQCLLHDKHVLIEKPFATTVEEAKELLALAKERNLLILPYQNRRFDSDFLALKEVLVKGYLGELVEIESRLDYYRPDAPDAPGQYYDGALFGLGVHTIDQMVSLFGRPKAVYYDIRSIRNPKNPDDYFQVELFYPTFKVILKTSHIVKTPSARFTAHGTKGSFIKTRIDQQEACLKAGIFPPTPGFGEDDTDHYGKVTFTDNNAEDHILPIPTPQGDYGRVYDHLYESIINGKPTYVSEAEILTVMEILESGRKSSTPTIVILP
nr:oxidoreductase [Neobacillus sp. Marseille-Q6967]